MPNQCEMLAHPPVQAFHIDWVIFQKMPKNSQKFENYPINVKCLHRGGAQAFHIDWVVLYIDWAVFKMAKKILKYFHIDWAVLKYCPINV